MALSYVKVAGHHLRIIARRSSSLIEIGRVRRRRREFIRVATAAGGGRSGALETSGIAHLKRFSFQAFGQSLLVRSFLDFLQVTQQSAVVGPRRRLSAGRRYRLRHPVVMEPRRPELLLAVRRPSSDGRPVRFGRQYFVDAEPFEVQHQLRPERVRAHVYGDHAERKERVGIDRFLPVSDDRRKIQQVLQW